MEMSSPWPNWQKYLCLCFCIYSILYITPFPFTYVGVFPEMGDFINRYTWFKFIPWFGHTLLGIEEEIPFTANSSGDRLYYWIRSFVCIILGVVGALVILFTDRKRPSYKTLLHWTNVYIVYFLIGGMVLYGMQKVIKLQFGDPNLLTLLQEYGHFSPAYMAWSFMGHSAIYVFFAGISEVTGAVFLLFRRTRVLGAAIVFGVTLNVFMFDVSYDISVKLYSLHLTLFALYIAIKDGRLLQLLLFNSPTVAAQFQDHFKDQKLNRFLSFGKIIIVSSFIIWQFNRSLKRYNMIHDPSNVPFLYGIYDVSHFEVNGDTIPPLLTDRNRWRKLVIQNKGVGFVKPMYNNSNRSYRTTLDTLDQKILFKGVSDSTDVYDLNYRIEADSLLFLTGFHNADTVQIHLTKYDLSRYKVLNTEVDWVSDVTKF